MFRLVHRLVGRWERGGVAGPTAVPTSDPLERPFDPTYQNRWIRAAVEGGRSFADVGGLWGTLNERVSVAVLAGSGRAAMVDMQPLGHELWTAFYEHCEGQGAIGYESINADAMDSHLPEQVGTFDVVHCSGVIYHVSSPIDLLRNLARITQHRLVLTSTVVPAAVTTASGRCVIEPTCPRFVPFMSDVDRRIYGEHFDRMGLTIAHLNGDPVDEWIAPATQQIDFSPWWWLFTPASLRRIIGLCGLEILDEGFTWEDKAYGFLLNPRP